MNIEDDQFFERLRADAQVLRHQPDDVTLARIRARISSRLQPRSVSDVLAAWFRPLTAALAAIAVAAAIGAATFGGGEEVSLTSTTFEVSMAGDTYRVGN